MKKTTKKTSSTSGQVTYIEKIAELSGMNGDRSVRFGKRVYDNGRETFTLSVNDEPEKEFKTIQFVELEKPELTELLVQAFELLKNPKLIHDLKMPTEMKQ